MSNPSFELNAELQQAVSQFFQRIPFNQMLGIELDELLHNATCTPGADRIARHLVID